MRGLHITWLLWVSVWLADADHSLYVQTNDSGIVFICIYVDDLIVGGDHVADVEHINSLLKKEFDMNDLGELHFFLGIEIIRTSEGISLL